MNHRPRLIFFLFCCALSGGCAGLLTSSEPANHVYWLEPVDLRLGESTSVERPELIVEVSAVPGLDTDRLLIRDSGARLNHYAGARWPDFLPEVLTAALRVSLESSDRFHRVSSETARSGDAWVLALEVREFFAVAGTARALPDVRVQLAGHVTCAGNETVVSAAGTAAVRENRLERIVAAFQRATDDAFTDLGRQLETHCFDPVGQRRDSPDRTTQP